MVCQGDSLGAARKRSISSAPRTTRLPPAPEPAQELSAREGRASCSRSTRRSPTSASFRSIQKAVNDSGNNDRVVVMPGRYKEKHVAQAADQRPGCADLLQDNGSGGMAPSYATRRVPERPEPDLRPGPRGPDDPPPEPPLAEREGIPDARPCIRCNFQIEGSGAKPDRRGHRRREGLRRQGQPAGRQAGRRRDGGGVLRRARARYAKDVVMRVDRADGFVGRNFLTKSSTEHGIYIEEVDGYLLDRIKFFWSAEYGNLTFTSDHGLYKNCDAFGAGDAAVYPGAAPETGDGAEDTDFYPDAPRSTPSSRSATCARAPSPTRAHRATPCGSPTTTSTQHHRRRRPTRSQPSGTPATRPTATWSTTTTSTRTTSTPTREDRPFVNTVGPPDRRRDRVAGRATRAPSTTTTSSTTGAGARCCSRVPEALDARHARGPEHRRVRARATRRSSTSCENEYYDNVMGEARRASSRRGGRASSATRPASTELGTPNGVDFWWDEFPGNEGNCWHDNVGPDGTREA